MTTLFAPGYAEEPLASYRFHVRRTVPALTFFIARDSTGSRPWLSSLAPPGPPQDPPVLSHPLLAAVEFALPPRCPLR